MCTLKSDLTSFLKKEAQDRPLCPVCRAQVYERQRFRTPFMNSDEYSDAVALLRRVMYDACNFFSVSHSDRVLYPMVRGRDAVERYKGSSEDLLKEIIHKAKMAAESL